MIRARHRLLLQGAAMKSVSIWAVLSFSLAMLLAGCGGGGDANSRDCGGDADLSKIRYSDAADRKFVILGFDGVDPDMVQKGFDDGRLPNLARLAGTGTFERLEVSNPPQSPVSWTSFSTCTWPGEHGIFDFLARDPRTYFPKVAFQEIGTPAFDGKGNLEKKPTARSLRHGVTFWKLVADAGIPVTALNIPYSFPPDRVKGGALLSGLGVPDVRGTNSTCYFYSTDLTTEDLNNPPGGTRYFSLEKGGRKYESVIEGPYAVEGKRKPIEIPVTFKVNSEKSTVSIKTCGRTEEVPVGEFSGFFKLEFPITSRYTMAGIARFHVLDAGPGLSLYLTPISMHPAEQYIPFSFPMGFAAGLAAKFGCFKNVGWVHDTSGLNSGRLPESVFLEDSFGIMEAREEMTLDRLAAGREDLFISVFTITDRVSHMFYRYIDEDHPGYDAAEAEKFGSAIDRTYNRMDEIVGEVSALLGPEDVLMIISDHGFHSFRSGLNVNTWLVRNGYMVLKGYETANPAEIPDDAFEDGNFFRKVNWSKTRAYSVGTAQVYVNLSGREGKGIVKKNDGEYSGLLAEIAAGLEAVVDPATGEHPVQKAYIESEVYSGSSMDRAPDIQLAFAEGYQTSWETRMGGMSAELIAENEKKWSGEHAGSDVADTEGIFFCNRKISAEPAIIDIGVTAMSFLGAEVPERMAGKNLLASE